MESDIGLWGVPLAILGGAIRVSTPFIFVSLGETITERSGRINLGLEGTLVFGAMAAYGTAVITQSPWLGVLTAAVSGTMFGLFHGWICKFPRVNDIAGLSAHPQLRRVPVQTSNGTVAVPVPGAGIADTSPAFGPVPALGAHTEMAYREFLGEKP